MLKKLIKYDFKSTVRFMIPIYLILIFITVLTKIVTNLNVFDGILSFVPIIIKITYEIILAGIIVITYIMQAFRYYTSMVTDEGYQTFTLPVKTSYLTISKLVTAISWNLSSILLVIISLGVVFYSKENKEAFIAVLKIQFDNLAAATGLNVFVMVVLLIIMLVIILMTYNLFIYTAIALGQIILAKNKLAGAFLAVIIIYMAIQVMMMIILIPAMLVLKINIVDDSSGNMILFITICTLFQILISIIMYNMINHIFSKRLNLD